jgi:hypothetical protein
VPGVNVQVGGRPVAAPVYTGYYPQSPWYSDPSVRQELQLTDAQYNQLNQSYERAWTRYNQERNLIDNKLTPEQRQQREGELRAGFQKEYMPTVDSTFRDQTARQRYNQLYYQYQGYDAFQDPAVQKQLNLTAEQQQQLNQYGTAWNQKFNTWRSEYPNNREAVARQFREARRAENKRIHDTLTPAQRKQWNEMIGKPYEFQSDVYFAGPTTTTTTLKPVIR